MTPLRITFRMNCGFQRLMLKLNIISRTFFQRTSA